MNVLIAPDSFKDALSAKEVAHALKEGIAQAYQGGPVKIVPLADGGEGTVEAVISSLRGDYVETWVHDPLNRKVLCRYGIAGDTAIIEMAVASGLELLSKEERNPLLTSTYGTGELILDAVRRGCRKIIMGIGGSATNDAGVGMAKALGFRFFDHKDNEVPATAQHLGDINRIDDSEVLIDLKEVIIQVACDVKNPMTGESGASLVYAQQKGAGQKSVRILEQSMKKFIPVLEKYCCRAINHVPGAGAAGGLGGGLIAFAGAGLENGFNLIAQVLNLDSHIRESDVILTAEGKLDEQSLSGKVPYGVMKLGKKYNKIVFGVAGTIKGSFSDFYKEGFDALFPVQNKPMGLKESISKSSDLLINTGVTIGNILNLLIKKKM